MSPNLLEHDLQAHIGTTAYRVEVQWRNGSLIMDEPTHLGGGDTGPDPYTTLLAALAGCTLSTLRMYIDRKGWEVSDIRVRLNMYQSQNPLHTTMERHIHLPDSLEAAQRERLLAIAQKCPVSRILEHDITINTYV